MRFITIHTLTDHGGVVLSCDSREQAGVAKRLHKPPEQGAAPAVKK